MRKNSFYKQFTKQMRNSGEYVIDYENKARHIIRFHRRNGDDEGFYDDGEGEGGGEGKKPQEDKKKKKQQQAQAQNRDKKGRFKKGFKGGIRGIQRREFSSGNKLDKHGSQHNAKGQFPVGNKPWNAGKHSRGSRRR